ncbi:MAG: hypothetical protein AAF603_02800 [Pseudomonadota bacterium]
MKMMVASLFNVAAVAGGIVGGTALRPQGAPAEEMPSIKNEEEKKQKAEEPAKEGEKEAIPEARADFYHLKFSRPFVVPVADGWRTQSLIVITLNVEMHNDVSMDIPNLQEKLRDKMMTGLVTFSHEGGFTGPMTDPALYEKIRLVTRDSIEKLYPEKVGDVLILEMLRRDV